MTPSLAASWTRTSRTPRSGPRRARADPPPKGGTPWRACGWRRSARAPGAGHNPKETPTMPRRFNPRPLTDAERDARRQADRERLEQAARALLTTDGWQRWIRVRATNGLARYSRRQPVDHRPGLPPPRHHPDLRRRLPRLPRAQPLRPQGRDGDQDPRPGRRQGARRQRRGDRQEARLLPHRAGLRRLDDRRPARQDDPIPLAPPARADRPATATRT